MKLRRITTSLAAGLLCAGVASGALADTTSDSESPMVEEESMKEAGATFARYFAKLDQLISRAQGAVAKAELESPDSVEEVVTQIRSAREDASERLDGLRDGEIDLSTNESRKALQVELDSIGRTAQEAYKRALSRN